MRHEGLSPDQDGVSSAGPSPLRNGEALRDLDDQTLQSLADALLPLLLTRIHDLPLPGSGAASGSESGGERTSDERGARPEHDTQSASISPGFRVQEVPAMVGSVDVNGFYRELIHQLGNHAFRGGTAFGAAAVAKRVAKDYGLTVAEDVGLPRPTRAERQDLAWNGKRGRT